MAQFLETYGFELILVLYSIFSSIVNVLTFRRTGTTNKTIRGSDSSTANLTADIDKKKQKAIDKVGKARNKLKKLLIDNDLFDYGTPFYKSDEIDVPKDGA